MNKWPIGKVIKLKKEKTLREDEKEKYLSIYYVGDKTGYHEHDIDITILKDGSLTIGEEDGQGFMYLYPEQVKHLKTILRARR